MKIILQNSDETEEGMKESEVTTNFAGSMSIYALCCIVKLCS